MSVKIGIFRALDVRFTHAEFASSFRQFTPLFAANMPLEMEQYLTRSNIDYKNLSLKPVYHIDPVYPLVKKKDFSPWLAFDSEELEQAVKGVHVYEIYEPYFFYSDQIAKLAKKNNVPLITEIWTSFPEHPSQFFPPYSFLVKNVIKHTDLFVLRSQKALSYLKPFAIPDKKKVVLYQGVNLERFYPAKTETEKMTILFVGALAPHKGLDDLLDVFPGLVDKYKRNISLVICGDGPLQKRVVQMAHDYPIVYKGVVSHQDLPHIYRAATVYCQPSKDYYFFGIKSGEEFAGYTFMEALASGLPIVSTQCGGIPEIVGDGNYLISQGNKHELFEALDTLLANKNLRNETNKKNRERAKKYFDLFAQTKLLEKNIKDKLI